jgi:hypothetical protein
MSNTFIFDTETLGRFDSSIILSLAIVKIPENDFNPIQRYWEWNPEKEEFIPEENWIYLKLERTEQAKLKRTICQETLDWWKTQKNPGALEVLSNKNVVPIAEAYKKVIQFLGRQKYTKNDIIFSRRLFESKLWENFCQSLSKKYNNIVNPILYWTYRDSATLCDFLGSDTNAGITANNFPKFVAHNALHDVFLDMMRILSLTEEN